MVQEYVIDLSQMIPSHAKYEWYWNTENDWIEDVTPYVDTCFPHKCETNRLDIGGKFYHENRKKEVGVYESLQSFKKDGIFTGIFFTDFTKQVNAKASDTEVEEISSNVSYPSEQKNERKTK